MNPLLRIGLLIGLATAGVADACRCREPTVGVALAHARAVAVGRITGVREVDKSRSMLSVRVERSWKRRLGGEVEVGTGTTCALVAKAGQRYLLFLGQEADGSFYTAKCMGDQLDPSSATLAVLDRRAAGSVETASR